MLIPCGLLVSVTEEIDEPLECPRELEGWKIHPPIFPVSGCQASMSSMAADFLTQLAKHGVHTGKPREPLRRELPAFWNINAGRRQRCKL